MKRRTLCRSCLAGLLTTISLILAAEEIYVSEKNGRRIYSNTPQSLPGRKISAESRPPLRPEDYSCLDAESARTGQADDNFWREQEQARRHEAELQRQRDARRRAAAQARERGSEPQAGERTGYRNSATGKTGSRLNDSYFQRQQLLEKNEKDANGS